MKWKKSNEILSPMNAVTFETSVKVQLNLIIAAKFSEKYFHFIQFWSLCKGDILTCNDGTKQNSTKMWVQHKKKILDRIEKKI